MGISLCHREYAGGFLKAIEVRSLPFDLRKPALFRAYWHDASDYAAAVNACRCWLMMNVQDE